jgi:hypothetical protein
VTERILAQGEERGVERCGRIATDERRCYASKGARRFAVARARPLVCVAVLASEHARAITARQTHVITL